MINITKQTLHKLGFIELEYNGLNVRYKLRDNKKNGYYFDLILTEYKTESGNLSLQLSIYEPEKIYEVGNSNVTIEELNQPIAWNIHDEERLVKLIMTLTNKTKW